MGLLILSPACRQPQENQDGRGAYQWEILLKEEYRHYGGAGLIGFVLINAKRRSPCGVGRRASETMKFRKTI
jgi:hypothetical protein